MPFLEGLLFGAGICGTVGPQSLFVLRQGIRGDGVLAVALICTLADVLLIAAAVLGADAFAAVSPSATSLATWAAAMFALAYGYLALATATRATLRPARQLPEITAGVYVWPLSVAFALSFLNPQVYIEMLFLVGGVSLQFAPSNRPLFGLGVALVSPLWFFGLALGGRRCARFFMRPMPIVMLDAGSGILMLGLAALIIVRELV
jgi:L-lysine exporter family protein LysE/ArgO